jgi:hypothetical protein
MMHCVRVDHALTVCSSSTRFNLVSPAPEGRQFIDDDHLRGKQSTEACLHGPILPYQLRRGARRFVDSPTYLVSCSF